MKQSIILVVVNTMLTVAPTMNSVTCVRMVCVGVWWSEGMGKRKRWVWGLYNHIFVDLGLEGGKEAEKLEVLYFYFYFLYFEFVNILYRILVIKKLT